MSERRRVNRKNIRLNGDGTVDVIEVISMAGGGKPSKVLKETVILGVKATPEQNELSIQLQKQAAAYEKWAAERGFR